MALDVTAEEEARRDDLVDRLYVHDVRYMGGGSAWSGRPSPYRGPSDAPVGPLARALVHSRDARLRTALTAMLLRHPEYVPEALQAASIEHDARAVERIRVSVLAAAALQRVWAFSLDLYLPGWSPIDADALAAHLGVPSPAEDYGRATLDALDALLRRDESFPTDHRGSWEDVGRHVMDDLRQEGASDVAPRRYPS